ncbi:Rieske 2Fe-2S domain-containing protein [Oscillochloris sp. ZM17-4]|uniref:aromatic ring-hydroxylating oxygenase subunit alpha n=1 Tax=Oscillochloris sp. ZM17-4 TaxID=2866714 RepID=UPI001C73BA19|nr:SRPBCC family protein [Oscillochloris sp. ZM17-4]MBX0328634.1 Rieske 2Fe-2S domain-containing protein [Oscillochloris sp. ZM17-4]
MLPLEQERIFGRTWQLVGRAEQLQLPGDFITCQVVDEPIVVTRDGVGQLHAFYNVCRHRAGSVAEGCGNRKTLQCQYHAWTYGLDGRLLNTPEWEGVENFERADYGLRPVQVDTWGPFVFVNLDPQAPPLGEVLGAIPAETAHMPLGRMGFYKRIDYEIACNWKVYVDNYLEGYHIPPAHPGLFKEIDYKQYRVETFRHYSKQHAPIREKPDSLYMRHLEDGAPAQALYYWAFPNLMLNIYPDNLQINIILPLGPDRTVTIFEWYVLDADRPDVAEEFHKSFKFSDLIQKEDIDICESVQRRLRSRSYSTGRYSLLRENGVHHFHGLLAEYLQG